MRNSHFEVTRNQNANSSYPFLLYLQCDISKLHWVSKSNV